MAEGGGRGLLMSGFLGRSSVNTGGNEMLSIDGAEGGINGQMG